MDNHNAPPTPLQPQSQPQPQLQPKPPLPTLKPHRKLALTVLTSILVIVSAAIAVYFAFAQSPKPVDDPATIGNFKQSDQKADGVSIASLGDAYDGFYRHGVTDFTPSKKQATLDAYATLSKGFSFKDTFPGSKSSMLASLGIAYLYTDDSSHKDNYRNELYQLSSAHLSSLPTGISDEAFARNTQSFAKTIATFKKYQDSRLTADMEKAIIDSGLARDVANNLNLSSVSDLAEYHVVVTNFDGTSDGQKTFAAEHYMYGSTPKMWVESVDGDMYLLIAKDYAKDFIAEPSGRLRSTIMHEFIHVQNAFVLGDLGRTIEERRAELFSDDVSSYFDAKQLFTYTKAFSGIDMLDMLQASPTSPDDFYLNLYATFGVKTANTIIVSTPSVFLSDPSPSVKSVQELTGGMDGVMKDMIAIGKKDQASMDGRIKQRVDQLLKVFTSKERLRQDLDDSLTASYGMPSATREMKRSIDSN